MVCCGRDQGTRIETNRNGDHPGHADRFGLYTVYLRDSILLAKILPFSNLIVIGNWLPLAAAFVAGYQVSLVANGSDVRLLELSLQPTSLERSGGSSIYRWEYERLLFGRPVRVDVLGIAPIDRLGELTWLTTQLAGSRAGRVPVYRHPQTPYGVRELRL